MDKHFLTRLIGKFSFLIPLLFLTVLPSCLPLLTGAGLIAAGGGGDGGGGGGGGGNAGPTGPPSPSVVYMWVSTTTNNGNIGGINGADTICETDSSTPSFATSVSTHRAVLRNSTNDPRNYFANNPPVQRPDGTVITTTYSRFFGNGAANNAVSTAAGTYWTGEIANCANWTSASNGDNGNNGLRSSTSGSRWNAAAISCNNAQTLLCMSY